MSGVGLRHIRSERKKFFDWRRLQSAGDKATGSPKYIPIELVCGCSQSLGPLIFDGQKNHVKLILEASKILLKKVTRTCISIIFYLRAFKGTIAIFWRRGP